MNLIWTVALIALAALASAAIGIALAESPWGALAGVPGPVVGIWQTWRGHQRDQANARRFAEFEERTRPLTPGEQLRADQDAMARQTSIRIVRGGDR